MQNRYQIYLILFLLILSLSQISFSQEEPEKGLIPFTMAGELSFPDEIEIQENEKTYIFKPTLGVVKDTIHLDRNYENIDSLFKQAKGTLQYAKDHYLMVDLSTWGEPGRYLSFGLK